ncbi:hypothetical protein [uncultured Spirosoma sp.]|uniref:hypothetical protein n=1 Tax=uncultured Spirosoma sp. TaxID=278208 RepID=UPI00258DAE87|nr:hypothetical protein [uncultured Spirosoma sp.]
MRYYSGLICMAIGLLSCDKPEVSSVVSTCYPSVNATRSQRITDAAVTVRASGGLATGYLLMASNDVAWSACNLPDEFKRDSLAIYVSGYSLTWPALESMNINLLPFEVTGARLR